MRVVIDAAEWRERAVGERRRRQLETARMIEAGRLRQRAVIDQTVAEELGERNDGLRPRVLLGRGVRRRVIAVPRTASRIGVPRARWRCGRR
jgi:hypothetical protein